MAAARRLLTAHPRAVGGVALGATAGIGAVMLLRGQQLDLWTFALALPMLVAAVAWGPSAGPVAPRGPLLRDELDEETGVGNGRAALTMIERERDRVTSHGSVFSIAVVDIGREAFADLPHRRATRVLSTLLQNVAGDVRIGDQVCRVGTSDRELAVVLLSDTGAEGARLFTDRLTSHTQRHLVAQGLPIDGLVRAQTLTLPGDEDQVARFERRLQVLVGAEDLIQGVKVRPRRPRSSAADITGPLEVPGGRVARD